MRIVSVKDGRSKALAQLIRAKGGAVTAEELAPYMDPDDGPGGADDYVDERYVLPAVTRFGGVPEVTADGDIIYSFDDLQTSAAGTGRADMLMKSTPSELKRLAASEGISVEGLFDKEDMVETISTAMRMRETMQSSAPLKPYLEEQPYEFSLATSGQQLAVGYAYARVHTHAHAHTQARTHARTHPASCELSESAPQAAWCRESDRGAVLGITVWVACSGRQAACRTAGLRAGACQRRPPWWHSKQMRCRFPRVYCGREVADARLDVSAATFVEVLLTVRVRVAGGLPSVGGVWRGLCVGASCAVSEGAARQCRDRKA